MIETFLNAACVVSLASTLWRFNGYGLKRRAIVKRDGTDDRIGIIACATVTTDNWPKRLTLETVSVAIVGFGKGNRVSRPAASAEHDRDCLGKSIPRRHGRLLIRDTR
jgi:hypothetical protein